ncbi:MAG: DUF499 domain-containing protein [Bryobacteraceae bacterium]|nr:DUF499 domain-containing protein [Bryobacteraceae bacterium]
MLPAAGRPKSVIVVGIDAGKAGVPQFGKHGAIKVHSLWGELFFRLGDEKALKALGKADDPEASPSEDQIASVFPKGPVLVLLDELVIYMARLSDRGQGNLLGFLNSLVAVVSKRPQTVLVLTDPARQAAYASESASLAVSLESTAVKLNEMQSRKVSDFDPIGSESAQIIVRRLFEKVDPVAAQSASASYHSLYRRVGQEMKDPEIQQASTQAYAKRIVECYPFHPRLLDTAQERLSAMQDFQKSRGVLRLFARILRDLHDRKEDRDLVSAGDIDWSSERIRADLLQRLQRDRFDAAVKADIEKHAQELDGETRRGIHVRVASALLLESLPMQPTSGMDKGDMTLAVVRPEEAGPEAGEALDRLAGVCWHTYPMESGRGLQFRYEANIIKQIEDRMRDVSVEDARSRVLADAQGYFGGPTFRLAAWPKTASAVSNSAELQLALCEDTEVADAVCRHEDNSDPKAPMPRRFRNAIVGVAPTRSAFEEAITRACRLMAAEAIEKDAKGESGKQTRDQVARVKPELQKRFHTQTRRAFDQIYSASGLLGKLDEKFQVSEEQMLQQPYGQPCIKRFLEEKELIYKAGATLDTSLFMKNILDGAVPLAGTLDAFTAKAIHERFLSAPNLRLVPDGQIVRNTLLKAVEQGKIAVRLPDGRTYDGRGCVQGPEGQRRRAPATLTGISLTDDVLISSIGSTSADAWLKEDAPKQQKEGKEGEDEIPPPPPPPPSRATATTWDQLIELSADRPLLELSLIARTPSLASTLAGLAQPLGADGLTLSVTVGGNLKDGGRMNFAASGVSLNHPTRPLPTAQTIFNSLSEGVSYEAVLRLSFGASGRRGLMDSLQQMRENAADGVQIKAQFDRAEGATA